MDEPQVGVCLCEIAIFSISFEGLTFPHDRNQLAEVTFSLRYNITDNKMGSLAAVLTRVQEKTKGPSRERNTAVTVHT